MRKYKEIVLYILAGIITTWINWGAYYGLIGLFEIHYIISNSIAWFISVIASYFMNRCFVFSEGKQEDTNKSIGIELGRFIATRIASVLFETIVLFIGVQIIKIEPMLTKLGAAVIVVILNYITSKWFVFS